MISDIPKSVSCSRSLSFRRIVVVLLAVVVVVVVVVGWMERREKIPFHAKEEPSLCSVLTCSTHAGGQELFESKTVRIKKYTNSNWPIVI